MPTMTTYSERGALLIVRFRQPFTISNRTAFLDGKANLVKTDQ
jgi:hypothetical protein